MKDKVLEVLNHLEIQGESGPIDKGLVCDQILAFLAEWKRWSGKIDLTSESDDLSVLQKHVFDSLQYARALRCVGWTMDIGSGAGFPGIPLKIVYPKMHMVFVESRKKRANYLKSVVRALNLTNIEVINDRAENLAPMEQYAGQFDQVVFKAVAPLFQCLEWGLPFLKEGGLIVIKKEPVAELPLDCKAPDSVGPLRLRDKIAIQSLSGIPSDLLIFEKCST
ncbi:MAG: 16S rRNA (guanine(527)-N(7))-methyltransferase RsmG [Nitrospinae bacterium RIFCSPLOWO2_12_FULL_47_7]|nr:MAG: 16S rRNA (guanine(527)-N(7))-methyltransferase RsmG [Nitrospinae bacterium RIFCSPLOWO2_12_FULL_47_7]